MNSSDEVNQEERIKGLCIADGVRIIRIGNGPWIVWIPADTYSYPVTLRDDVAWALGIGQNREETREPYSAQRNISRARRVSGWDD